MPPMSSISSLQLVHQAALARQRATCAMTLLLETRGEVDQLRQTLTLQQSKHQQEVSKLKQELSKQKQQHQKSETKLKKEIQRLTKALEKAKNTVTKQKKKAAAAAASATPPKRKKSNPQQQQPPSEKNDEAATAAAEEGMQHPTKKTKTTHTSSTTTTNKHDTKWNLRLEALKQFKAQHGHCQVSKCTYKNDTSGLKELAAWVSFQRHSHKMLREGKYSTLTPARIQQLTDIGFDWTFNQKPNCKTWEERYVQLVAWQAQHGHTRVPQQEAGGLGHWVIDQRRYYRGSKAHTKILTAERIQKLEALGFEWSLRNSGSGGGGGRGATTATAACANPPNNHNANEANKNEGGDGSSSQAAAASLVQVGTISHLQHPQFGLL